MNKLGRLVYFCAVGYSPCAYSGNLHIRPDTSVRRLLFEGRRCTGVEMQPSHLPDGDTVSHARVGPPSDSLRGCTNVTNNLARSGVGATGQLAQLGRYGCRCARGWPNLSDHPASVLFVKPAIRH